MQDVWLQEQHKDLNERVARSAEYYASMSSEDRDQIEKEAREFSERDCATSYPDFLDLVRQAADLAISWKARVPSDTANSGDTSEHQSSS